jgi:transcriptional regulator with XRE-family HTH domain
MNNNGRCIQIDVDMKVLGRRVREAREAAGVSQDEARKAIEVSQPTYSRIESGERPLKGDELIQLADRFGIRAAVITGLEEVRERARFAARTDGNVSPMATMRERLYAYLELDSYLTSQGIAGA